MEKKFNVLGKELLIEEVIIIVLGFVGIVATFLPYITISMGMISNSHSLIKIGDGFIYIIIYILCMALALNKKPIFASIGAIILVFLMVIQYVGIDEGQKVLSSFSVGFFVTLLVVAGIIGCSVLAYLRNKNGSASIEKGFSTIAQKTKGATSTIISKASDMSTNKKTSTCPKCSKAYSNEMNFCPECGAPKPIETKKICSRCNSTLEENAKFCPKCGEQVVELVMKSPMVCKNCGTELKEGAVFCGNCGNELGE